VLVHYRVAALPLPASWGRDTLKTNVRDTTGVSRTIQETTLVYLNQRRQGNYLDLLSEAASSVEQVGHTSFCLVTMPITV
jgi:hypothetical protein